MAIRVCHVTSVHPYRDGRIFRKECASLSKRYEVCLIAPNTENQMLDGICVFGVQLPKGRFERMRNLDIVYKKMLEVDADIYHFHDPELVPIGIKVKNRGKRIIFDSHEDVPVSISEKKWIPSFLRKPLSAFYRNYEKRVFRKYDALVSVTPSIVERLKTYNRNTYQVTNYPILNDFIDKRTWDNSICFTGGVSAQWLHENVIRSLDGSDTRYVVAGNTEADYLEKLMGLPGWGNVDYRGVVPQSEVSTIQMSCFAGVALNDYVANVGFKLGSLGNTKLFEYMMSGIPVIATDFVLWKEIIDKYQCGICVNPHDIDAIKSAIVYLRENPVEAKRMGDNGRKAVQEVYNWQSQEEILFEMYDNVLSQ